MSTNIDPNLITSLLVGLFVGAASGYLGSLMVLKRMALVGDALSHVALPGIGIALTYGINPFLGAFAALAVGILLVWKLEKKTDIPAEAIVGLIFAVSLAIGLLVTPEPELLESLFGDIASVSVFDALLAVVLSSVVILVSGLIRKKIALEIISPDLARSEGLNDRLLSLAFLGMVAVVVALGVKVVGTLLMGSLVIIPALAAKNLTRTFGVYSWASLILGAICAVGGIALASALNFPPGPIVVLASAGVFVVSLIRIK